MAASAAQSKNWMFTINNPTDADRPLEASKIPKTSSGSRNQSCYSHFYSCWNMAGSFWRSLINYLKNFSKLSQELFKTLPRTFHFLALRQTHPLSWIGSDRRSFILEVTRLQERNGSWNVTGSEIFVRTCPILITWMACCRLIYLPINMTQSV